MTTATRRLAPDERAATEDPTTPPSSTPQPSPTRTTLTPPSPPRGNHETQKSLPNNTFKTKNCNLETFGPHLNTLEDIVKQYSPSVSETQQAHQHTKRTRAKCPNHHTQTTHTNNRKHPHVVFNPTPASDTAGDITSPDTQHLTYIIEIPYALSITIDSHPNPPHNSNTETTHPH